MSIKALAGARSELLPGSPLFPAGLLEIEEPVKRLYCIGDVRVLGSPALAIVGARKATPYGLSCAHRFARRAAQAGITVVSGGAIGCDQAAHRGALEGGGKTIVVLGCGADVVYPARAYSLFEEVLATGGAVVTEAPWGSPPSKWGFRRRNRIIAALAHSTLIVEAGLPSGTFSTADATLAQGKDVLVVPGSIDSMESRGSNRLLLQGAMPVIDLDSFDDALSIIFGQCSGAYGSVRSRGSGDESGGLDGLDVMGGSGGSDDLDELEGLDGADAIGGSGGLDGSSEPDETRSEDQRLEPEELILQACAARPMRAEELVKPTATDLLSVIRLLSALELQRKLRRLRDGRYTTINSCGACAPLW